MAKSVCKFKYLRALPGDSMTLHTRLLLALFSILALVACGPGSTGGTGGTDEDGDGYSPPDDCNDSDPDIHPGAEDVVGDMVDSDCDDADGPAGDDDDTATDDDDAVAVDPGDFDTTETITGDFSCVGNLPAPTLGENGDLVGLIEDFQDEFGVPSAFVELWLDNDPSTGDPDWEGQSSNDPPIGQFTTEGEIIAACAPFAARVYTDAIPQETYQTFEVGIVVAGVPPFAETFNSVSYSTYQLLPLKVGVEPLDGLGIAAGRMRDCNADPVGNGEASVGTIDFGTGVVTDAEGYRMRYFDDESPDGAQMNISADGLFGGLNVPPGDQQTLMVWGIPQDEAHCLTTTGGDIIWSEDNSALCLLGTSTMVVQPDSVNIANVNLRPLPAACYQ